MSFSIRLRQLPALTLLAFVASAGLSSAQDPSVPSSLEPTNEVAAPQDTRAWESFLAENGALWSARWNPATGTPSSIIGSGIDLGVGAILDEATARQQGQLVLYRYAQLLGIDPTHFVLRTVQKTLKVWILVYDMVYQGVPVVGGRADLRICDNGVLAKLGAVAPQLPAGFTVVPTLSAEAARRLAHASQGAPLPQDLRGVEDADGGKSEVAAASGARLVIWTQVQGKARTPMQLAWEVRVEDSIRGKYGRVFVDAHTGQSIDYQSDVHHADVTGNVKSWVNTSDRGIAALSNVDMAGIKVTSPTLGTTFTDASGNFLFANAPAGNHNLTVTYEGRRLASHSTAQGIKVSVGAVATPGTPVQIQMLTSAAAEFDRAQAAAYHHVNQAHEFVRGILGANLPAASNALTCRTNIASTCNAFYNGTSINFYAAGGSCNNTASGSVVAHEWGHGLDDWYGGISQTEGLSEAWGDTISTYLFAQPIVGRDFQTSGAFVRSALNTRLYSAMASCNGSVHCMGESFMGLTWDIRTRLIASLGAVAGKARAEQIVIGSIPADAVNQPDAVEEIFLLDDNDGNLSNGTPNYSDLAAAASGRQFPYPQVQLVSFSHVGLTNTTERFAPRRADITVQALSGTINAVQAFITVTGGAPRLLPAIPNGLPNGRSVLLPGADSGASVSYYFIIQHSSGNVRRPETGAYGYSIGSSTVAFSDNFDSGENGWTSQQIATQNDWQRGTPAGRTATDTGVTWRDPSAARSGTACRGNDLGGAGFNGAYQNNVENLLLSPVLNLTGRTGVRVGFWRWLSVEDGLYDQAKLEMNGQVIWANPVGSGSSHVLDTAWTYVEYAVPAADNNPSVQFGFRLKTDAGLALGGWNIDDFAVSYAGSAATRPVEYQATPEQIQLGGATTLRFRGTPSSGLLLFFSATPGPLSLPGFPTLNVDINFLLQSYALDGAGNLSFPVAVPPDGAMYGLYLYSQAVQVTPSIVLGESNPMTYLFY
ncbi:MAG: hypothetical protein IPN34_09100 [Planctomycetes bacterium]|nr:hypothetical protein [Planctomycetota bacterium]